MKQTQAIQNYRVKNTAQARQSMNYFKRIVTFLLSLRPFATKKEMELLRQEVTLKQQEVSRLKWELMQKNEMVKNIAFHQSHSVRRPLANILGVIELMNATKSELPEADLHELFSLLKISADTLDRAIKHNSTAGQL